MTASDWASVLRRAKAMDETAFDEIVDAYAGRLYGFFRRMLNASPEAEDLVQEVFVRVVKGISQYREEGRFEAWLFRIAGNLVRDRLRLELREDGKGATQGLGDLESRIDARTVGAAVKLEHGEDADRLQAFLARLPAAEREVILMRYYGELSFAEIAEYTGAPLGTALARAHRGLGKLRQWMESST